MPKEPDSLTHYSECPRLYNIFIFFRKYAADIATKNSFTTRLDHSSLLTAFNMEFWYWASLMLLFMPITSVANIEGFALWRPSLLSTPTHIRQRVLFHTYLVNRTQTSGYPSPKSGIRIFPMLVPQHVKEAMILMSRLCTGGCIRVVDGETLAGWGVIARSPHGRTDVMFVPVVTTEAHLAFSGTRTHSNNSAVMTATIEALSFFVLHGRFGLNEQSCSFYDSLLAAEARSRLATGTRVSKIHDFGSAQTSTHHATCVWSQW